VKEWVRNYKMKNKKGEGILEPETLKTIAAIVVVAILAYFVISFFDIFMQNTSFEQAQKSLLKIEQNIYYANSEGKPVEFFLESPNEWGVFSFPFGELKPLQCGRDYCVCICEFQKSDKVGKNIYLNECDKKEKGSCMAVLEEVSINENIVIKGLTFLEVYEEGGKIIIKNVKK